MEVRFKPETESQLIELAARIGRAPDDLVEDAMAGYLAELVEVRGVPDSRYEDIKSARAKTIDGETFLRICGTAKGNSTVEFVILERGDGTFLQGV